MKKLLFKTAVFFAILIAFFALLYMLSPTPKSKCSLLFADLDKKELLRKNLSNRIIFVGGSNLSFGLNCQIIKDSLGLNPINTSIHAGLGLYYMLDNYKSYFHKGDIVVISPEYEQFYGDYAYGEEVLIRTIVDVNRENYKLLKLKHFKIHLGSVPKILLSKLSIEDYKYQCSGGFHERTAFNQFGDAVAHWNSTATGGYSLHVLEGDYNFKLISYLKDFEKDMDKIGVKVFITYPCFDAESFDSNIDKIRFHERQIIDSGMETLGNPERYKFKKEFCFDSPYHLNKKGAEIRTNLLIENLKSELHL
jgi:hypothetical protein